MVKQAKGGMISSTAIPAVLRVLGKSGRELPHVAFANLRQGKEALIQFRQSWAGPLLGDEAASKLGADEDARPEDSSQYVKEVFQRQEWLRNAWQDDPVAREYTIQEGTRNMWARWEFRAGRIELTPDYLWNAICLLFLRDDAAKKTAVCANPDCPARFFIKARHSQRFCGSGPCADYGRRQVALRSWRKHKDEWRPKTQAKRAKTKGKKP